MRLSEFKRRVWEKGNTPHAAPPTFTPDGSDDEKAAFRLLTDDAKLTIELTYEEWLARGKPLPESDEFDAFIDAVESRGTASEPIDESKDVEPSKPE